jgi:transcriptional regulator with XRE-family HTH domain
MASNPTALSLRAKKLGVLLRDARLASRRSLEDCAETLCVSPSVFEAYELGEKSPSLPELELLSFSLHIPLEHFLGNRLLSQDKEASPLVDREVLLTLRQRMVGVLIRKARMEAHLTIAELSERVHISPELLEAYELGEVSVPIPELDAILTALGYTVKDFQDRHGPVGSWFIQQRVVHEFQELDPELQAFVSKPVNRPYIELARRLSEMSVERLRTVAEVLLEITL